MVFYTDNDLVTGHTVTAVPSSKRTVSGYGSMLATTHMVKYEGRWHRVYAMQYGNAASLYIIRKAGDLFLDHETEWDMQDLAKRIKR